MAGIKNIIRKQTVHFQYNGQADGFALQKEVSDWCAHTLIPQLERQLEPYCSPHWHLILDKLELNATVDGADWQEQIQQQVITALQTELAHQQNIASSATDRLATDTAVGPVVQQLPQQALGHHLFNKQKADKPTAMLTGGHADKDDAAGVANTPLTTEALAAATSENLVKKQTSLVLFFLQHGYLPWWSNTILAQPFVQWLPQWLSGQLSTDTAQPQGVQTRVQQLVQQVKALASDTATARLVQHLPPQHYSTFVHRAFPEAAADWSHIEQLISDLPTLTVSRSKYNQVLVQMQQAWLTEKLSSSATQGAPAWVPLLYQTMLSARSNKKGDKAAAAAPIELPAAVIASNPMARQWQQWVAQKQQAGSPANLQSTTSEGGQAPATLPNQFLQQPKGQANDKKPVAKQTDKPTAPPKQSPAVIAELAEGIFIENAGAVIVAPFLPMLFNTLQWVKNGAMLQPAKAAWLIQYMVTGSTAIGEADLVLPKILCGMEPDAVISLRQKITAQQKKEVQELLTSVVAHWSILKNTSPEGLQQSFLQRQGKLVFANDQWLLQVEQKSYDMLLQQLPWNINMIKLPWMKNLLRTEWA